MTLTNNDKHRIEAEERHRETVRKKIKRDRDLPKNVASAVVLFGLVFLVG